MKKLVIFDLDGTLLDTLKDLAESVNSVLKEFGYQPHELGRYCYFVGDGIPRLIERALPEDARSAEKIKEVKAEFMAYYRVHKMDYTRPYPGICALLEELHHRGILLAVASNKVQEVTCELVHSFFGSGLFDVVLGQLEGRPAKPDPAIVNEIMGITGVHPEDVLYVGDSEVDMRTAANSGVESVGVTWGFRPRRELEESGAGHIVEHPDEITLFL